MGVWLAACGGERDAPPPTDAPTEETVEPSTAIGSTRAGVVGVTPSDPVTGDPLTGTVLEPARQDGEPVPMDLSWERNGIAVPEFGADVTAGVVVRDEVWTLVGAPAGGGVEAFAQVLIGNAPPTVAGAVLEPSTPSAVEATACWATGTFDAEGDVLEVTVEFEVDGSLTGLDLLPAGAVRGGQRVRCGVTVDDGHGGIATAWSAEAVAVNAPPVVEIVGMTPDPPVWLHEATCTAVVSDPDGDGTTVDFRWLEDGVEVSTGPSWVVQTRPGSVVTCEATAHDGLEFGAPKTRDAVVVDGPRNFLLVIVDDLGVDKVGAYEAHPTVPPTPTLDALTSMGRTFRFAYANPTCSATRSVIMTGRWGYQTGVGTALGCLGNAALPTEEETIAEYLGSRGYWTELLGKWHLDTKDFDFFNSPAVHGFDRFDSTLHGFGNSCTFDGLKQEYYSWEHCVDGVCSRETTYEPSAMVDEAIARVPLLPEPFLYVLAFNLPHAPYERPPDDLWSGIEVGSDIRRIHDYKSMVEALDNEIGRLLESIDPVLVARTDILLLGDNGTPDDGTDVPWIATRAKGTTYEAGVHVPLIVVGPDVAEPGVWTDARVHAIDLFATLADLGGSPLAGDHPAAETSRSLRSLLIDPLATEARETVYAEDFTPPGVRDSWDEYHQGIRNDRYRLVRTLTTGIEEMYDMTGGYVETGPNLLDGDLTVEEQAAYDELIAALPVKPF
jgi:arylsulfatase A-like enzyme